MSSHPSKSVPRVLLPAAPCEPDGRSSDKSPFSDPVAKAGEGANGRAAAVSNDPVSREGEFADRQRHSLSGFTGEGEVELVGLPTLTLHAFKDPIIVLLIIAVLILSGFVFLPAIEVRA